MVLPDEREGLLYEPELLLEEALDELALYVREGDTVVRDEVEETERVLVTLNDAERAGVTALLREVVVVALREGVEAAVRVVTDVLALLRETVVALRVAVAVVLRVEAEVLRVAVALLVRILLLPKEREAAADEAALRVDVPATALRVEAPCAIAVRVAARRSTSKERALLMLRPALRVENERSG